MKNTSIDSCSTPKFFYDSITDITPKDILSMGGKAVGIDLDNTTVYDSTLRFFTGVPEWIDRIKNAGIPVVIVTNTYSIRAKLISKKLKALPYIANANKPDTGCFFKAADISGVDISEFVMIGDQLFTDVQGANKAGAISVMVKYKKREIIAFFHFMSVRKKERIYLESKGLGDKI